MKNEKKIDYQRLLIKLFNREISDSEITLVKSWIEQDPENRRIFDEENELWQETSAYLKHDIYDTDNAWINISSKLGFGKTSANTKTFTLRNWNNFRLLLVAASLIFVLCIGGVIFWIGEKTSFPQLAVTSTTIATHEKEKAHVFLSDSTEIILNSGSTLQYNNEYNQKSRNVKFTGEAFFNVRTNPNKPFVVELNGMKVSATGTRFNICSFENDDRVETTLEEGKIQVSINGLERLNLNSGQQVVYFVKSKKAIVRDVPIDTYSSWKEDKMRFIETPLEEVMRRIGRKYNAEFEINNKDLLNLKYTATFLDESVDEVMKMLSTVSPITYKISKPAPGTDKQYPKLKIIVEMKRSI